MATTRAWANNWGYSVAPLTSYGAGTMVCVAQNHARRYPTQIATLRANGAEVIEYTLPIHDYPYALEVEGAYFYNGVFTTNSSRAATPASWFWDPSNPGRAVVSGYDGQMMDMRAGSAWLNHLINDYYPWRLASSTWKLDGFLLDVVGDGYLGYCSGLSSTELDALAAGNRWFVQQLRAKVGNICILVNNNYWLNNNSYSNGIIIEGHSDYSNTFWNTVFGRMTNTKRRNASWGTSETVACGFAGLSNIDFVNKQNTGQYTSTMPTLPWGTCGITSPGWTSGMNHTQGWDSTTYASGGGSPGSQSITGAGGIASAQTLSNPVVTRGTPPSGPQTVGGIVGIVSANNFGNPFVSFPPDPTVESRGVIFDPIISPMGLARRKR